MLTMLEPPHAEALASHAGSSLGESYTQKDVDDLYELTLNAFVLQNPSRFDPVTDAAESVVDDLANLVSLLPKQRQRDREQEQFQQFSTPAHYAYLVAWAANLGPTDVVLEPSAGVGGLCVHALNAGCEVVANELSERRAKHLNFIASGRKMRVFTEDAAQLDNILPADVLPTACTMNPPFSATAGRMGDKKSLVGYAHVRQALKRLQPGGRLVTILGASRDGSITNHWRSFLKEIRRDNSLVADIGIPRETYRRYGTEFPTRMLVIDKWPGPFCTVFADADSLCGAVALLRPVRERQFGIPHLATGQVRMPGSLFGGLDNDENDDVLGVSGHGVSDSTEHAATKKSRVPADDTGGVSPVRRFTDCPCEPLAIEAIEVAPNDSPMTDAVFEAYRPQRLKVAGALPHPTPLVQSSAMASVLPPVPTYRPMLPKELVTEGILSEAQLEAVVYAGQAHSQSVEFMHDGKSMKARRGYFVGDATGLGKGREIAAVILDSFYRGETKAIWVTKSAKLVRDAIRDWVDIGGSPSDFIELRKVSPSQDVPDRPGILFATYGLLRAGGKMKAPPEKRLAELPERLGVEPWDERSLLKLANGVTERNWRYASQLYLPKKRKDLFAALCELYPEFRNNDPRYSRSDLLPTKRQIRATLGIPAPVAPESKKASRLDQVLKWAGAKWSGCLCFDEAHAARSALAIEK